MKRSLLLLSLLVGNQLSAQHIVSTGTAKNVLLEAVVSANQFFTPTAYCTQDNMRSNSNLIIVNHHSTTAFTDAMSVTNDYDLWEDTYITGYPFWLIIKFSLHRSPCNKEAGSTGNSVSSLLQSLSVILMSE